MRLADRLTNPAVKFPPGWIDSKFITKSSTGVKEQFEMVAGPATRIDDEISIDCWVFVFKAQLSP